MSETPRERCAASLGALAEPAKKFPMWDSQFIPDLLLYHLALDVLEQGRAVIALVDAEVGRPAYSNSRAAFEAAADMLILTAVPSEYCLMGARARAWELVDGERLGQRRAKAAATMGRTTSLARRPEQVVEEEAKRWDSFVSERGNLLREALPFARKLRVGAHWSGLSRRDQAGRIAALTEDPGETEAMLDGTYGMQSLHVHPGSRIGLRTTSMRDDGSLFVEPRALDLIAPLNFMTTASELARNALTRRPLGKPLP